jgi:ParB family chromosome partitioning protein
MTSSAARVASKRSFNWGRQRFRQSSSTQKKAIAWRQHRAIDLLQDISTLRGRGYKDHEIAAKIGVSVDYIRMIGTLLENGEERLVSAVEAGILPLNMAIEIARSSDEDVQRALTQAYTEKKLRGKKLVAVRRILEQRRRSGKQIH